MKFTKKSFTYGVELEGLFSNELADKIYNENLGQLKHDGSVRFNYSEINGWINDDNYNEHNEIASKVFDYKKLIKYLKLFNNNDYRYNNTTGCHLHIGFKNGVENMKLQRLTCEYKFISRLQKIAKTEMCNCQKSRFDDDYYYKTYGTKNSLIDGYKRQSKYKFLRFHPIGTLEFRFLKPCEHKIDNINKLIDLLIDYLNTDYKAINVKNDIAKKNDIKLTDFNVKLPEKNEILTDFELNKWNNFSYNKYKINHNEIIVI